MSCVKLSYKPKPRKGSEQDGNLYPEDGKPIDRSVKDGKRETDEKRILHTVV